MAGPTAAAYALRARSSARSSLPTELRGSWLSSAIRLPRDERLVVDGTRHDAWADNEAVADRCGRAGGRHGVVFDQHRGLGVLDDQGALVRRQAVIDRGKGGAKGPAAKNASRKAPWLGPSQATLSPRTTPRRLRPPASRRMRIASSA